MARNKVSALEFRALALLCVLLLVLLDFATCQAPRPKRPSGSKASGQKNGAVPAPSRQVEENDEVVAVEVDNQGSQEKAKQFKEKAPADVDANVIEVVIEHSLSDPTGKSKAEDDKTFVRRGIMKVKLNADGNIKSASVPKIEFSSHDIQALKDLAERGLFYRVRIISDPADSTSTPIVGSFPVCELQASGFKEYWYVHVFEHRITGISFQTSGSSCFKAKAKLVEPKTTLSSKVMVVGPSTSEGPEVEPVSEHRKSSQKRGENGGDEEQEEPGFFRKYWYILLIGFIMMSLQQPPEAGGAPAQQGAAAGGARRR